MAKAIVLPPEVLERMKAEYLAGESPVALGFTYGVSHSWVRKKLRAMGVKMRSSHNRYGEPSPLGELQEIEAAEAYEAGASFSDLARRFGRGRLFFREILVARGVEIRGVGRVVGKSYPRDGRPRPQDGRPRCKECTIVLEKCPPVERMHERDGLCGECAGYVPERFALSLGGY